MATSAQRALLHDLDRRTGDHADTEGRFWQAVAGYIAAGMTQRVAAETLGVTRECVRLNLLRYGGRDASA